MVTSVLATQSTTCSISWLWLLVSTSTSSSRARSRLATITRYHPLDQSETSTSWTNDSSPGQEAPHRLDVVGEEDPAEAAPQLKLGRGAAALGHRACTSIHCLGQCPDWKGGLQKLNLNASLLNVPVILLWFGLTCLLLAVSIFKHISLRDALL